MNKTGDALRVWSEIRSCPWRMKKPKLSPVRSKIMVTPPPMIAVVMMVVARPALVA
jgi:hypothetical protein